MSRSGFSLPIRARTYERLVREGRVTNSDEYFGKLAYVDITETVSYTAHISSNWLRFYNWLAFLSSMSATTRFVPCVLRAPCATWPPTNMSLAAKWLSAPS